VVGGTDTVHQQLNNTLCCLPKGPSGVQAARQGPLDSLVSSWPA